MTFAAWIPSNTITPLTIALELAARDGETLSLDQTDII